MLYPSELGICISSTQLMQMLLAQVPHSENHSERERHKSPSLRTTGWSLEVGGRVGKGRRNSGSLTSSGSLTKLAQHL